MTGDPCTQPFKLNRHFSTPWLLAVLYELQPVCLESWQYIGHGEFDKSLVIVVDKPTSMGTSRSFDK